MSRGGESRKDLVRKREREIISAKKHIDNQRRKKVVERISETEFKAINQTYITKTSSIKQVAEHFGCSNELAKVVKFNLDFFKENLGYINVVKDILGTKKYNMCRINDMVGFFEFLNINHKFKVPLSIGTLFDKELRNNVLDLRAYGGKSFRDVIYDLYNGESVKEVTKRVLGLTPAQHKRFVNIKHPNDLPQCYVYAITGAQIPRAFSYTNWMFNVLRYVLNGQRNNGLQLYVVEKLPEMISLGYKPTTIGEIYDYITFIQTYMFDNRDEARNYLYSRSPKNLKRESDLWHDNQIMTGAAYSTWNMRLYGADLTDELPFTDVDPVDNSVWRYYVTELGDSLSLAEEGRVQRHCVSSYTYKCMKGKTSIVSLRKRKEGSKDFRRLVTIEIDNDLGRIVQARRAMNQLITKRDEETIIVYCKLMGLKWMAFGS